MKKCLHANSARPSDDRLTTVQFHPSAQVVMTAGLDQSLSLFQVDGKTNPKIQSIHLERFPVHRAQFSLDGQTVIATSLRNKMFYLYDMMQGRVTPVHTVRGLNESRVKEFSVCPEGGALLLTGTSGYLHLLTLKTKEVVRSMKINGDVSGVAFSRDGGKVFVNSEEGEVYVWDVRSSRCVNRFTDDGCVKGTSIAASPNGQYLACGSDSGVVNIYSQEACLNSANPKPLKAVMNLLTSATSLTLTPPLRSWPSPPGPRTRPYGWSTCRASASSPTSPSRRGRSFIEPSASTSPPTAASSHWPTTKDTPPSS
ncbi:U3 small nucleolar RNA-associated protein 18 homolog, partial [Lates japonicus]